MFTQYEFYKSKQNKYPEAIMFMREFDSYQILGQNANKVLPLIESVLTHKDAGKMFCYSPTEYGYPYLSFGKHNLDKVLPSVIRAGFRIVIIDYNEYRHSPEYKTDEERFWSKYKADKQKNEEKKQRQQATELELLFEW